MTMNFHKNELIDECLSVYYATFLRTLDTCDYVPANFNAKIHKYIYKNMRRQFSLIDKADKQYQKQLKRHKSPETARSTAERPVLNNPPDTAQTPP